MKKQLCLIVFGALIAGAASGNSVPDACVEYLESTVCLGSSEADLPTANHAHHRGEDAAITFTSSPGQSQSLTVYLEEGAVVGMYHYQPDVPILGRINSILNLYRRQGLTLPYANKWITQNENRDVTWELGARWDGDGRVVIREVARGVETGIWSADWIRKHSGRPPWSMFGI